MDTLISIVQDDTTERRTFRCTKCVMDECGNTTVDCLVTRTHPAACTTAGKTLVKKLYKDANENMASFAFVPLEGGNEIALEDGKVTVGRGPFLRIVDKRVSRHHAIVEISGSTMTVLPIHTNPTFYKGFGATKFEPLEKTEAKELQDGDCIAFLPNDLVFKVLKKDKVSSFEKELKDETEERSGHCIDSKEEGKMPKSKKLEEGSDLQIGVCEEEKEVEALLLKKSRILPSWMTNSKGKTPSKTSRKTSGTKAKKNESCATSCAETSVQAVMIVNEEEKKEEVDKNDHDDILLEKDTKIMDSPVEEKEEDKAISAESEEEDLNCNDPKKRKREKSKEEDVSPHATKRGKVLPRCPYGAQCYRKNPVHFEEYSHTSSAQSDSENNLSEDEGDLPECPYGTSCFRKNRQHQKEYQHTATPRTRERRAKKKAGLGGVKDDDDTPNDDFEDSFIDDESGSSCEPSEHEDSDWQPDDKDSGDEDVGQLLSEARNFAKNKKMLKP